MGVCARGTARLQLSREASHVDVIYPFLNFACLATVVCDASPCKQMANTRSGHGNGRGRTGSRGPTRSAGRSSSRAASAAKTTRRQPATRGASRGAARTASPRPRGRRAEPADDGSDSGHRRGGSNDSGGGGDGDEGRVTWEAVARTILDRMTAMEGRFQLVQRAVGDFQERGGSPAAAPENGDDDAGRDSDHGGGHPGAESSPCPGSGDKDLKRGSCRGA